MSEEMTADAEALGGEMVTATPAYSTRFRLNSQVAHRLS
jgi:hypothetical protein